MYPSLLSPLPPLSLPPPPPSAQPLPLIAPLPEQPMMWRPISTGGSVPQEKKEMSPEEKREVWMERIKCVRSSSPLPITQPLVSQTLVRRLSERMQQTHLEHDISNCRRLIQSSAFPSLPDEDKSALQTQLDDAQVQCEEKKKSLSSLVTRLMDTGFWPILPPYDVPAFDEKYNDMKASLGQVGTSISQLQENIATVTLQHLKRRGAAGLAPDAQHALGLPAHHTDPSEMDDGLDGLLDRIRTVDHRIAVLENDLTQHARDMSNEFDNQLDAKVDELLSDPHILAQADAAVSPRVQQALDKVSRDLTSVGTDIQELAGEVAALIQLSGDMARDNDRLKKQHQEAERRLAELEQDAKARSEAIAQLTQQHATFKYALAQHLKRPPPPVPQPPPLDLVFRAIEQPTIELVRETMKPLLLDLRQSIERLFQAQEQDLYSVVWPKLVDSMKMTELIIAWIDREDHQGLEEIRSQEAPSATRPAPVP
ncbi:hypothetical protein EW146_g1824 [Bondarzewia mesenterica]|uniref:Uncharacterized protein n=1 Tax=Bondarzewia mesenterica TaxID=1095465 RepID=A0A4S4M4G8_9AGAM|nr:hypothetical protein EW146_g1824 [Bondarzewia mesenterica]